MSTLLEIVVAAVSVLTFAAVVWLFIWAAKKDGEEDRAIRDDSASADVLGWDVDLTLPMARAARLS
jgi:hypothetical protein